MKRLSVVGMALLIGLSASGCARYAPGPGAATSRMETLARAEISARQAASQELAAALGGGPLSLADSGFPAEFLQQLDLNRNGQLDKNEKVSAFREVWGAMTAIAQARRPDDTLERAENQQPSQEYRVPHPLTFGPTSAEVFIDAAEIMPAVFNTLKNAQRSIWMDVFLLGGSEGLKLAELLVAKVRDGLDVRIIHDPGYGLAGTANAQIVPVIRFLLANGVQVKSYPLAYLPRRKGHPLANRFQIDHNKFIIVDQHTAMVGTMNLIDLGVMNHDIYLKLSGDAAQELAAIHEATWGLRGAKPPVFEKEKRTAAAPFKLLSNGSFLTPGFSPNGQARVTKTDIDQQTTKKILLEAIETSRRTVDIAIFEFGDTDVANALVRAYKRGVMVRVLADRNANYHKYLDAFKNLKLYGTPNLLTANILRDAGVPVKWYVPQLEDQELHMKLALVDGERALLGSTNFTNQAFSTFRETNLDLLSPPVVSRLKVMFQRDWDERGAPVGKPNFQEKCIIAAVRSFDKFRLSWW